MAKNKVGVMKKAFKLLLTYLILLIVIVGAASLCYSLFLSISNYIVGTKFNPFDSKIFMVAFFRVFCCVLIIICPICIYKQIRYKRTFYTFISYIFICIINWMILFPVALHFENKFSSKSFETHRLSERQFREGYDGKVFYFTRDFGTSPLTYQDTPTIIIEPEKYNSISIKDVKDTSDFELYEKAQPYSDVLIKDVFGESTFSRFVNMELLIKNGFSSLKKGLSYFLGYLSIALALCCLYSLLQFFDWRLLTATFVTLGTVIILSINTLYYLPSLDYFRKNIISKSNFFMFCQKYVDEPLLVICNLSIALILIVAGIIKFSVKKVHKGKKSNKGEYK